MIDFPIYQGGFISGIRSEQGGEILTRASEEGGNMGKWARGEIFMKCDKMWEMWENNGEIEHGSFHRSFSVWDLVHGGCFKKRTGILTNLVGFLIE